MHEFVFEKSSSQPPEKSPSSFDPRYDLSDDSFLLHSDRSVVQVHKFDRHLARKKFKVNNDSLLSIKDSSITTFSLTFFAGETRRLELS